MPGLLERYLRGEHVPVWAELRALGDLKDAARADAWAVARETMQRVRRNVELVVRRLHEGGYRFIHPPGHRAPTQDAPALAEWLATRFGGLPLAARAWIEFVGDVNLMGSHPQWSAPGYDSGSDKHVLYTDPLVVEFELTLYEENPDPHGTFEGDYEHFQWKKEVGDDVGGRCHLSNAPDEIHKANHSGGGPYGILVPDSGADAIFYLDGPTEPFVDYLRRAFASGGFPGFASNELGDADGGTLKGLIGGLVAF